MKLAWMTLAGTDTAITEALRRLEHIADAFLSPSVLPQVALPAWLSTQGAVRAQITARTRHNREALAALTTDTALTTLATEAGWYAVVRLPAIASEEEWTLGLLERHGVLVQPGYFYDFEDEPYVIVSLLTPERVFREGVERLVRYAADVAA
jgi:aspartate/methionine/tyrosine aminotransferase